MFIITSKENDLESIDLLRDYQRVVEWKERNNILSAADNDIVRLALMVAGEVEEVVEQRELLESETYQNNDVVARNYAWEIVDSAVFAHAFSRKKWNSPVDTYKTQRYVNGMAKSSNIYDQMREVAGNLSSDRTDLGLHWFFANWISLFKYSPIPLDSGASMSQVILKNESNYPTRLFHDENITDDDERLAAYQHRAPATRIIRKHIKKTEGERALRSSDYMPHVDLLLPYESSEVSLYLLRERLGS